MGIKCSCTFIFGGSNRGPFTYVFSYESFVSCHWRSDFRTNSRYAYWTLCINERRRGIRVNRYNPWNCRN
uniref:Uncharacterized protein n=1 Tax=Utricularia reniformis TaxID=192314 RepID=A0A1Y0B125_9LAMI|nr:hypothetical protein AEK19_MT0878 [Utricularia reniformis]ART31110.1 hypothetical protein AEK19_MT0878 [Utricularia reniformis]